MTVVDQTRREKATALVKKLVSAGFKAYFAGGCVRDMALGAEPKDYDIATDARPDDIRRLFERTIPIGAAFGVINVLYGEDAFEVATFRADGPYLDGRHPASVRFLSDREDALRRDFTVNGMFYDPLKEETIDYVGGLADLKSRIVRAIGDPEERIAEDRLRMLRAVRFAAGLGFAVEGATFAAVRKHAAEIATVSAERIRDEIVKILTGGNAAVGVHLLKESGLLAVVLPEVAAMEGVGQPEQFHPEGDVLNHTLLMLELAEKPSVTLALGILLHDIGKPGTYSVQDRIRFHGHTTVGADMAARLMKRLRFSTRETEAVVDLVREHLQFMNVREMRESTLKRFLRRENFDEHLALHRLDCLASHGKLDNYRFCLLKRREYGPETIAPPRLLTGHDLIALGLRPGPIFRKILDSIEDAQLEGKLQGREEALKMAEELIRREGPPRGDSS
jgi:poly(A) polymerase